MVDVRGGLRLGMAVNLSVRLLTDPDPPTRVASLLGKCGVPPSMLTLEITERSIMVDPSRTTTLLGLLRELGVLLSIDDFGTGYSSLAHLMRLDVDALKNDRSFVFSLACNSNDAVIVRSPIELGHNLGLRLVVEGVEDAATWSVLSAMDCDVIQGYHLWRPLPREQLDVWIEAHTDPRRRAPAPVSAARLRRTLAA